MGFLAFWNRKRPLLSWISIRKERGRNPFFHRLRLEPLEDRRLLSVYDFSETWQNATPGTVVGYNPSQPSQLPVEIKGDTCSWVGGTYGYAVGQNDYISVSSDHHININTYDSAFVSTYHDWGWDFRGMPMIPLTDNTQIEFDMTGGQSANAKDNITVALEVDVGTWHGYQNFYYVLSTTTLPEASLGMQIALGHSIRNLDDDFSSHWGAWGNFEEWKELMGGSLYITGLSLVVYNHSYESNVRGWATLGGISLNNFEPVVVATEGLSAGYNPLLNQFTFDASNSYATTADGSIASYSWEFGDGSTANTGRATHAYGSAGDFPVTVTVTDNDGLSMSKTLDCKVNTPAILVHGWQGDPSVWTNLTFALHNKDIGYAIFDYSPATGDPRVYANQLGGWIDTLRDQTGYEWGQFDIVCHSMGALVSRWYMMTQAYSGNYPIRKWIGIAPVNHGADVANQQSSWEWKLFLKKAFQATGFMDTEEAVTQLRPNSQTVMTLNNYGLTSGVEYHVIAGVNAGLFGITLGPTGLTTQGDGAVALSRAILKGATLDCYELSHCDLPRNSEVCARVADYLEPDEETPLPGDGSALGGVRGSGDSETLSLVTMSGGTVFSGAVLTVPYAVDGDATELLVGMVWEQGTLGLSLVSPSGVEYTPQNLGGSQYAEDGTTNYYLLNLPEAGIWTAKVSGIDVGTAGEPFSLLTAVTSPITLDAVTGDGGSIYAVGDPIPLTATLKNGDIPLLGGAVVANVVRPDLLVDQVALYDDGAHGDGAAGDGVYGNTYIAPRLGLYAAEVSAQGNVAGTPYERTTAISWSAADYPKVASVEFVPNAIAVTFNEDVAIAPYALSLYNATFGWESILYLRSYDADTHTATWDFSGEGIPPGDYIGTVRQAGVTNASGYELLQDYTFSFSTTRVWDGGGADNRWTTAENWVGDVAPFSGNELIFPSNAARLESVNDFPADTVFRKITVCGTGYQFDSGVTASDSLRVRDGASLTATSITANSLTIGGVDTQYWYGMGEDQKMSSAANWTTGEAPLPGDNLVFPAWADTFTCANDFPTDTVFGDVVVEGGHYTFQNRGLNAQSVSVQNDASLTVPSITARTLTIGEEESGVESQAADGDCGGASGEQPATIRKSDGGGLELDSSPTTISCAAGVSPAPAIDALAAPSVNISPAPAAETAAPQAPSLENRKSIAADEELKVGPSSTIVCATIGSGTIGPIETSSSTRADDSALRYGHVAPILAMGKPEHLAASVESRKSPQIVPAFYAIHAASAEGTWNLSRFPVPEVSRSSFLDESSRTAGGWLSDVSQCRAKQREVIGQTASLTAVDAWFEGLAD
jgi:pimeloyl-ACP methyl ester carboxylesterase